MISIARKNLFSETVRFLFSIAGVAFSTFLIMSLLILYLAVMKQMAILVEKSDAHLWVMPSGTTNMFYTSGLLKESLRGQLERRVGGGSVSSMLSWMADVRVIPRDKYPTKRIRRKESKFDDSPKADAFLIGFDTTSGTGGPWKLKEGTATPKKGEVVIDSIIASGKGVGIGDNVQINNENFTVVGVSDESNLLRYGMVFMDIAETQRLLNAEDKVNFFLVTLSDPTLMADVQRRIDTEMEDVVARTKQEFIDEHIKLYNSADALYILPMIVIGVIVGSVVVGLTIYNATMEKIREFGILKAIGASNTALYLIVIEQSAWMVLFGYLGGLGLTAMTLPLLKNYIGLSMPLTPEALALTALATLVMAVTSAFLPIRRVNSVDPIVVFRS